MPMASQPTSRWANLMPKLNHPSTGSTPWHNPSMKLVHLRSQHSQISQKVQKADRTKTSQLSFYSKFIDDFEYKYCCLDLSWTPIHHAMISHECEYCNSQSLMNMNSAMFGYSLFIFMNTGPIHDKPWSKCQWPSLWGRINRIITD